MAEKTTGKATRSAWRRALVASLKGAALETLRRPDLDGLDVDLLPDWETVDERVLRAIGAANAVSPRETALVIPAPAVEEAAYPAAGAWSIRLARSAVEERLPRAAASPMVAVPEGLRALGARARARGVYLMVAAHDEGGLLEMALGERLGVPLLLGIDPFGTALARRAPVDRGCLEGLWQRIAELGHVEAPPLAIDGLAARLAGASRPLELALLVAAALAHLEGLTAAGMAVEDAARTISFRPVMDPEVLPSMASIRALRLLWRRVVLHAGSQDLRPPRIDVWCGPHELVGCDPWPNLLRATTAAAAALHTNVDSIRLLPFTAAGAVPRAEEARWTHNIPLLLRVEGGLGAVVDPGAGAWAVEARTAAVADAAWDLIGQILELGGIVRAIESGWVGEQLRGACARRRAALEAGEIERVGLNGAPPQQGEEGPALGRGSLSEPVEVPACAGELAAARAAALELSRAHPPGDRRVTLLWPGPPPGGPLLAWTKDLVLLAGLVPDTIFLDGPSGHRPAGTGPSSRLAIICAAPGRAAPAPPGSPFLWVHDDRPPAEPAPPHCQGRINRRDPLSASIRRLQSAFRRHTVAPAREKG